MEKYNRPGQVTDGNIIRRMTFEPWIRLQHTFRICNIYCFPRQQLYAWMRLFLFIDTKLTLDFGMEYFSYLCDANNFSWDMK